VPDVRTPFLISAEKETLLAFLDYVREGVIRKATGLDEIEARRALVPSGTSLVGLVKHLTAVEASWFQYLFAGLDDLPPSGTLGDDDTVASVIGVYRESIRRSNDIVARCSDLDQLCARPGPDFDRMSLRWVLVHMVEETARHAGHADIIREQSDGTVGR
jgi:hypothetical protein